MKEAFTLCLNLDILAPTQYVGYNFNSFTMFQGMPIAAGDEGIFLLDDKYSDDGEDINAWFECPTTALGTDKIKNLLRAILKYESNGALQITITADEGIISTYTVNSTLTSMNERGCTFVLERNAEGTDFAVKIANIGGCNFAVDSFSLLAIILSRYSMIRSSHGAGKTKIILSDFTVESNGSSS